MMKVESVRLPSELKKEIARLAETLDTTYSHVFRMLLIEGLKTVKTKGE